MNYISVADVLVTGNFVATIKSNLNPLPIDYGDGCWEKPDIFRFKYTSTSQTIPISKMEMTFSTGRLPFSMIIFDTNMHGLFTTDLLTMWELRVEERVGPAYMINFMAASTK